MRISLAFRRRIRLFLGLATLLSATLLSATLPSSLCAAEPLQAGFADIDITPPIPYRMSGYFSERLSTGVKDPLLAKACVLRQGDVQAAFVFCDLVGLSPAVAKEARRLVSLETGIPADHICIAATHSHTGPMYFGALREHFHARTKKKSGTDVYEKVDYANDLTLKLVEVVERAAEKAEPVELAAGYAEETRLSFNRRFHMKDGTVRFNPGYQNPNVVRVAGPIDPQVGLLSFQRPGDDAPFAALVAFALHLDTVGGTEYSADYPFHLQQRLRETFGGDFRSLFAAGTCGDINHVDITQSTRRTAEEIGTMLGTTVAKRLPELQPVRMPSLAVETATVQAPLQKYSPEEIEEARKKMELVDTRELSFLERVRVYKIMALQLRGGDSLPIEVQAFRISPDVAIVTLPGEVFVDLGIAIKQASPFETTIVIELANDTPGYIPTRKAFAEGSYETVNSRVEPGGGEAMVERAVELLRRLAD